MWIKVKIHYHKAHKQNHGWRRPTRHQIKSVSSVGMRCSQPSLLHIAFRTLAAANPPAVFHCLR